MHEPRPKLVERSRPPYAQAMSSPAQRQPYLSIAGSLRHEIDPIKGSRFIADLVPVSGKDEVRAAVAAVRADTRRRLLYAVCWGRR